MRRGGGWRETGGLDTAELGGVFRGGARPPPEDASSKEKRAYKLKAAAGQAIDRLRKCTVEPVIGIVKEVLRFRQFSLRARWRYWGNRVGSVWPSIMKRLHRLRMG